MRIPKYLVIILFIVVTLIFSFFKRHGTSSGYDFKFFQIRFVKKYDDKSTIRTSTNNRLFRATATQLFNVYNIPKLPDAKKRYELLKPFDYMMSKYERLLIYKLLEIFDRVLKENGIEWFMASGTLLGSYRMHDILPWDDDVDVFVNHVNRQLIQTLFKGFSKKHFKGSLVFYEAGDHDKLFLDKKSHKLSAYNWKWPYIDVSYYKLNDTHLYDLTGIKYGRVDTMSKSVVFPLKMRPLFIYNYPSPRDTFAYNVWIYGYTDMCVINSYSHILEEESFSGQVKCAKLLSNRYGYVKRTIAKVAGGEYAVIESLYWNNDTLVQRVQVNEPLYAQTETFSLRLNSWIIKNSKSQLSSKWRIPKYLPKMGYSGVSL